MCIIKRGTSWTICVSLARLDIQTIEHPVCEIRARAFIIHDRAPRADTLGAECFNDFFLNMTATGCRSLRYQSGDIMLTRCAWG